MSAKPLRVAVISTGWISSVSIRAIMRRPHLELVGVWVHSPDKVGRDAGEIVGLGPIGVLTTGALDDIIAAHEAMETGKTVGKILIDVAKLD